MTYAERVQTFASEYVNRYGLSHFTKNFGVPTSTVQGGLSRKGGFARPTHTRLARAIEAKIREAHAEGRPLEFNGIPLPVSDELERELLGEPSEAEPGHGDGTAEPDNLTAGLPGQTEAAADEDDDDSTLDETPAAEGEPAEAEPEPIFVPDGVSVLDPALWTDGPASESDEYRDHEKTAEDMRRIFEIDPGLIGAEGDDPWHGWLGPDPPEGVTPDSPDFRDEVTRLTAEWHDRITTLNVIREFEDKKSARIRQHLLQERYGIELRLVRDFFMTPPSKEIAFNELERRVEIERLRSIIVLPSEGRLGRMVKPFTTLAKWAFGRNA